MSDDQSLIKARYCRSILKVAAISTEQEARILLNGLATEQLTPNTSPAMAEAERAALTAIRDLAGYQHGRSVPQNSSEWMRAARAIQLSPHFPMPCLPRGELMRLNAPPRAIGIWPPTTWISAPTNIAAILAPTSITLSKRTIS
jgi:hypothetical protein